MIFFREVVVGRFGETLDGEVVLEPSGRFDWKAGLVSECCACDSPGDIAAYCGGDTAGFPLAAVF